MADKASLALTFALLVPVTSFAKESLKLRGNRQRRKIATSAIDGKKSIVAKLDFAFLFGRRCITFGSARSSEFLLPSDPEVSSSHFVIHLDLVTATLNLTDISQQGTWIRYGNNDSFTKVHHATVILRNNATIMLGKNMIFDYTPTTAMTTLRHDFLAAFRNYKSSILKRLDSKIDGRSRHALFVKDGSNCRGPRCQGEMDKLRRLSRVGVGCRVSSEDVVMGGIGLKS